MKPAFLLFVLIFSQVSFSFAQEVSQTIVCSENDASNSEVQYTVSSLQDFGLPPGDISQDLKNQISNSLCDFDGVYHESWSAACFLKSDLAALKSGDSVSELFLSGYEHGALYVDTVNTVSCKVK